MATLTHDAPPTSTAHEPGKRGLWSWITTTDHKRIGILYGLSSLFFFLVGGVEALFIRLQLAAPNGEVLSADAYNQMFTMHGTTMVFLVVMPAAGAFANYLLPLQLGARDVAFPRLNAFSFWVFFFGGVFLYASFFLGGGADGGWFGYAPLSTQIDEVVRMDYWALGLLVLGVASVASSINFVTTAFTMRAPGMTLMRMPVFSWMVVVISFLLLFSLPMVTVGLVQVFFDRNLGTLFYDAASGGEPILWQHLFWLFGHPEVYVLILPAMGIVSEVLPTFSRKPLFGRSFVIFSGIAIGFMGFGVWAHHMFTSGLGPVAEAAFALTTMFIAVPTGVKIFNWLGTMWGGSLRFTTAMLFSIGFIAMFVIGGLSGVTHSIVPADSQQHDSYYVVAHFHYVLFGGAIFGIFSGIYFWWPKLTGKLLDERIGKWHFWLMLVGFNLTFAPMHMLGLQGMMRRTFTYTDNQGFDVWNLVATIGVFVLAISILIFIWNIFHSYRAHKKEPVEVGADPWDARSLEWMIPSPTPEYNFSDTVVVEEFDEFWHRKYGHDEDGRLVRIAETEDVVQKPGATGIHLPSPSYWPLILASGFPLVGYGLIFNLWWCIPGALLLVLGIFGWVMEPADDPHGGHEEQHDPEPDSDAGSAGELGDGEHEEESADADAELEEAPVG